MHRRNSRPPRPCDDVLLVHEDGEQRLLLALHEQFGPHPGARAGSEEREVRDATLNAAY